MAVGGDERGRDSEEVITATNQMEGYFDDRSSGRMEHGAGGAREGAFVVFFFRFLFN